MSNFKIKSLKWVAPVAMVGVLGLAACGDEDASESTKTADVASGYGSDQHLYNQAAEIADASSGVAGSDQHLYNQAAEIAAEQRSNQAATDRLAGQAEAYEQSSTVGDGSDSANDEFVPDSRHM